MSLRWIFREFKKDEIKASLENGYLTITAEKGLEKDQKEGRGQEV